MVEFKYVSFQDALATTENYKRHLLLGNGFSISLFPQCFTYGSLLEGTDFSSSPELRSVFYVLGTKDFEIVIHALNQSSMILPIYNVDSDLVEKLKNHAQITKESLVQAIAGKHPERPAEISKVQYRACRAFLRHFIGNDRKNLRGCIYTLNYDLLLYWAMLHEFEEEDFRLECDDGFRNPEDEPDAEYVSWDGENSISQTVHYLHGALHLFDNGHELQKLCWKRSGGDPLIDQIRKALDDNKFPLYVSEGNSLSKYTRIRHTDYLHKALRSFRANCKIQNACLFIFGHSLAENDSHILKQIKKGKIKSIYISLYGDQNSDSNKQIVRRAEKIVSSRRANAALELTFFSAESAKVWE